MRGLIHTARRMDVRRPRTVMTILLTLMSIYLLSHYSNESYEYTAQSLQAMNEKLQLVNARIEGWKKMQELEKDYHVESVSLMDTPATSTQAPTTATTHFEETSNEIFQVDKQKAVIMLFARSLDLPKVLQTMRSLEDRFNKRYNYDWLIVSDSILSQNFKRMTSALGSGEVKFHSISRRQYMSYPDSVDKKRLKDARKMLRQKNVNTVKSQRVKHLQRLWVKEIFNLEPLNDYDYFMRVEPMTWFSCDIGFDPFRYMKDHDKTYSFAFAQRAEVKGYPTLWSNTLKYIEEHPDDISPKHLLEFVSDDQGETFNGCQIRTKFEIGDLRFFRSEQYQRLATYFDDTNGLYYEAWEDSTIRTMAVLLLQDRTKLQFLGSLGFNDMTDDRSLKQCPFERDIRLKAQCTCNPLDDVTWTDTSCVEKFFDVNGFKLPGDVPLRLAEKARYEEEKSKQDEQKKYEEEQLRLIREQEAAEQKKLMDENPVELEEQEGDPIDPGEGTPDVN